MAIKPLCFTIPIKTVSEANQRGNTSRAAIIKSARVKKQRQVTANCLIASLLLNKEGWSLKNKPVRITLTRHGDRKLDKDDNLPMAFKAVKDELANQFSFNDGDESVTWAYKQVVGGVYGYGVHVSIEFDAQPPADFDDKRVLERFGHWHNAVQDFVLYRCLNRLKPTFAEAFRRWCVEVLE